MKRLLVVMIALILFGCANSGHVGVSGGSSGISSISIGTGVRR
ncbi:hypothetical protein [Yersinia mollaretii]|uniref:Lipoprotein n=1 Tax=Yersinia mollaretii (strain ATCC 43969 / DSM 18520 / CIP 103324 / CNY 7263 / WAIP 204) TaxID=349967 RepID=A0ABM9YC65_YERMW|nr:hypothetical protein [Yersinia mollaretii]CNK14125.1 Uncharacterised protein [Yersinia enterocolitica]EEQ11482.1 hypothetical protein ymoll0001_20530 [Yersinia mollaretii ATCC 43969]MDN0109846.1 hypothetical protein [Yersinia mollaretii]CNI31925.1 Uncharacterised protein [Yersinia mollaretii]CNJ87837.1 Uncharacterised protein [Yersinia mollaretii]